MTDLSLKYILRIRELFIELVNGLSIEALNEIPEGFNNNIAWNFGHSIISTQGLCYLRSGVQPAMEIPLVEKYRKGSRPESFISKAEIDDLKAQAIAYLDQIKNDLASDRFKNITPYSTATFSYEMNTIEEVITCCLAHETLHYGYALALTKRLK
ncbi:DinB family protein [Arachidicoccus sp.]|uniref:DinB family protein n=1 Tax=Arachidicoccus sp. TaxID=1872624 RepID=UPI003D1C8514